MSIRARGGSLAPGGVVGDGRYRLLAQFGIDERAGAHLWRARDGQLRRDVALTILVGDPADAEAAGEARRTLERAAHAAQFTHNGVARVLDVLSLGNGIASGDGLLGIVVSDWTKGTDLLDLVGPNAERHLPPATAARMVHALAETVDQAHQSGLVLGIDHPQRLRVTPEGRLRLAFPGPLPDATLRDDVKALGGVLYLLLTGRWALPDGPPAIQAAPRSPTGRVVPAKSLEPSVPPELSSLAVRTIEDGDHGGIRSSSAILRMLDEAAAAEERAQRARQSGRQTESEGAVEADGTVWTTKKPVKDAARRRKLALGVTVLVVAAVGILAWVGMSLINFFQEDPASNGPKLNVGETSEQQPPPENSQQQPPAPPPQTGPVKPSSIELYNPGSKGDSPEDAGKAIDGDPTTVWRTDEYQQQLPSLKPGVGLLVTFDQPINLGTVKITADTPGTAVEVRLADNPKPDFSLTRPVANGQITDVRTNIALQQPEQARYVIVWLTKLSPDDGEYQSEIGELEFIAAP